MSQPDDPFNLERFRRGQAMVYDLALAEIAAGRKRTHWMWFIFPQLAGLAFSALSQHYAIGGRAEAAAYLADPLLGARLRECCEALLSVRGRTAHDIFGSPDDLKLRSSMTLFAAVTAPGSVFEQVLAACCNSERDPLTLALLPVD
jgi:uncharacterized protein (DUF1810 family)